jgi:hypothetical protein
MGYLIFKMILAGAWAVTGLLTLIREKSICKMQYGVLLLIYLLELLTQIIQQIKILMEV